MENKFNQFHNRQDMQQSVNILYSVATFLHIALGQIAGAEGITGKKIFSETERKNLVPTCDKLFKYMSKASDAFQSAISELDSKDNVKS